jgi:YjbR protein
LTANDFRRLALSLPEATESAHMDHPDFRVRGKIFATLGHPAEGWGMVKLTPEQQHYFAKDYPDAFVPVKGAW